MKSEQLKVRQFHEKYGQHVSDRVATPPDVVIHLRRELISEEANEIDLAFEKLLALDPELERRSPEWYQIMAEIADGLGDLMYVVLGTAIAFGFDMERVFAEIHRSNMTKTPKRALPGQKYAPGGGKGPDFSPARIKDILFGPVKPKRFFK